MTRRSLGLRSKHRLSAPLAGALCSALLLGTLPAWAQPTPAPAAPPPTVAPVAPVAPAVVPPTDTAPAAPMPPPDAPTEPPPAAATPTSPPEEVAPAPVAPPAEVAPAPVPPIEPMPETTPPPEKPKLPSYLMWGVGGASLIAGAALGIAAVAGESKFNDNPTYSKADSVHTEALLSDVGLGLGVILLATGTIFYFVDDSPPAQRAEHSVSPLARLEVSPVIGLKTQGAAVTLKF